MAVVRSHIAAEEFEAGDIEFDGRDGGVDGFHGVRWKLAGEGLAGEGLPSHGEMKAGVVLFLGEEFVDLVFLDRELEVEERGVDADEAGFAPTDGGEFVDEVELGVVGGTVTFAVAGEVDFPGVGVVGVDEDVDFGAESCRKEFQEERRLPSGLVGPLDLVPLMRA